MVNWSVLSRFRAVLKIPLQQMSLSVCPSLGVFIFIIEVLCRLEICKYNSYLHSLQFQPVERNQKHKGKTSCEADLYIEIIFNFKPVALAVAPSIV